MSATLVVGCGAKMLDGLQGHLPDGSVLVLEQPELIERRRFHERVARYPVVADLVPADYMHGAAAADLLALLPAGTSVDRVLPSTEVSVEATAALADELGLPGAGRRAAGLMRDKLELRGAAAAGGLPNPGWREVHDVAELKAAVHDLDSAEVVLKPTGRSGSQGVQILSRDDDLDEAWLGTTTARGVVQMDRPPPTRYVVEARLIGPEVSVESLVADGEVLFDNVTAKRVLPGRHPVETGHVLPAPVEPRVRDALLAATRALVRATGFGTGMMHGEWILTADGPVLVECAARIPGDQITDLLSLAYDFPFIARYAELMRGRPDAAPAPAVRSSAISFVLAGSTGTVGSVTGTDAAKSAPGVREVTVSVAEGDEVVELHASRDRLGHAVAVGSDAGEAWHRACDAAGMITVGMR